MRAIYPTAGPQSSDMMNGRRGSASLTAAADTSASRAQGRRKNPRRSRRRAQLLPRIVTHQHGEHDRDEKRKEASSRKMTGHLRPIAMSNASRITRKFSRPADDEKGVAVLVRWRR